MNLLTEPWMPVRKRDGTREWIPPHRLSDPDILAFDADRADFNGALAQFAIGLLQTTSPVDNSIEWRQLFNSAPAAAVLDGWFAPVATAFEFDGDGPRFMQDPVLRTGGGKTQGIGALLIDSPGNNALENNSDHFVKRGAVEATCDRCAAMALFTLQINAPEGGGGGGGKFTGIRGGGPLTTLLVSHPQRSLWQDQWLNVRERGGFLTLPGDPNKTRLADSFPWLRAESPALGASLVLTPTELHTAQAFWAMPRRIWLDFSLGTPGECDVCHEHATRLIRSYADSTGGLNYKEKSLWNHPLSPYREQARVGFQPVHPRGPIGYRHWLPWAASAGASGTRRARVVDWCMDASRHRVVPGQLKLWAFGYDMDSAKPQCWYEATLPLYGLDDCEARAQKEVESEIANWLGAAKCASEELSLAVKSAWFSKSGVKKWKSDQTKAFSAKVTAQLWSSTEQTFYTQLSHLIDGLRTGAAPNPLQYREKWHRQLVEVALNLFNDEVVEAGQIERQNPNRIAAAYQRMRISKDKTRGLYGSEMWQVLGLATRPASEEVNTWQER